MSRIFDALQRSQAEGAGFDFNEFEESSTRADKALHNQSRSPGLDLISRGGTVVVTVAK